MALSKEQVAQELHRMHILLETGQQNEKAVSQLFPGTAWSGWVKTGEEMPTIVELSAMRYRQIRQRNRVHTDAHEQMQAERQVLFYTLVKYWFSWCTNRHEDNKVIEKMLEYHARWPQIFDVQNQYGDNLLHMLALRGGFKHVRHKVEKIGKAINKPTFLALMTCKNDHQKTPFENAANVEMKCLLKDLVIERLGKQYYRSLLAPASDEDAASYAPRPVRRVDVSPVDDANCTVFVGNVPWSMDESDMHALFNSCGRIVAVRRATGAVVDKTVGFAHVVFEEKDAAEKAVAIDETIVSGHKIRLEYART